MMDNYLSILEESLRKKLLILTRIKEFNNKQQQIFQSDQPNVEEFDDFVDKKGALIEALSTLDEGFETLYDNIAEELKEKREEYASQIHTLQQLITQLTEMSMSIQAQEERNRKLVEAYFANERSNIRTGRVSSKVAYDYYKNVNKINNVPPQFMDKKK